MCGHDQALKTDKVTGEQYRLDCRTMREGRRVNGKWVQGECGDDGELFELASNRIRGAK